MPGCMLPGACPPRLRSRMEGELTATPTRDDALLMVQLARRGTELGVQDAIPRVLADDFDPRAAEMLVDRLPEK